MTTTAQIPAELTADEKAEMKNILDNVFGGFRPTLLDDAALKDPDVKRYDELSTRHAQFKAYKKSLKVEESEDDNNDSDVHEGSDSSKNTFMNPEHLYSLCCDTIEEGIASIDKLMAEYKKQTSL